MKSLAYDLNMHLIDLPISRKTKYLLEEIELYTIKDLCDNNYFTLKKRFTTNYYLGAAIKELNELGFLIPPDDEIFLYDINISSRLLHILTLNGFFYLSELTRIPKEHFRRFRNFGNQCMLELGQICSLYNIELKSLLPIKETFYQIGIKDSRYYDIFFENNIFNMIDFKNQSLENLYTFCGYKLTMKLYYTLAKQKLFFLEEDIYYIFQLLPAYQSRKFYLLYKAENIEDLTNVTVSDLSEKIGLSKASIRKLSTILEKNNLSFRIE